MQALDRVRAERPWNREPDSVDLVTVTGYKAAIRRIGPWGTLNGYLCVPVDHPWHGRGPNDVGGPYVVSGRGADFPYKVPLEPDNGWWFGMDTLRPHAVWPIMVEDPFYDRILVSTVEGGGVYVGVPDMLEGMEHLGGVAAEAGGPGGWPPMEPVLVYGVLPRPFTMGIGLERPPDMWELPPDVTS